LEALALKTFSSIAGFAETEIIIKKSRFIGRTYPVQNAKNVEKYLEEIRAKHKDASHNCYAYIIDNGNMRASDDGEPQGTAGVPILSVLKKRNLQKTLVIVTRYYGGIQLGSGGLISAYSATASEVLDKAGVRVFAETVIAKIRFSYEHEKTVEHIIKNCCTEILSKEYLETILFEFAVLSEKWHEMKNTLNRFAVRVENEAVCWR
jgi:uncharacterized YigZ family protein